MTGRYLKVIQGPYKSCIKVPQGSIMSCYCHITCLSLFRVPWGTFVPCLECFLTYITFERARPVSPISRRLVDVKISRKCIYDVSPYPYEHISLFNSFLNHPWAEKLTYKWTKLFAYFGTFDFKKYVFLFERVHSQSRWNASFDSFVKYTVQG